MLFNALRFPLARSNEISANQEYRVSIVFSISFEWELFEITLISVLIQVARYAASECNLLFQYVKFTKGLEIRTRNARNTYTFKFWNSNDVPF